MANPGTSSPFTKIRVHPDPVLRVVSSPVVEFDEALAQLAARMLAMMAAQGGIGLAAVQLGVAKRVLCWGLDDARLGTAPQVGVIVNPHVVESSGSWTVSEGCLSVPGILTPVTRARHAVIEGVDLEGNSMTIDDDAWVTRVLLHEMDHLDGVLIVDYGPPVSLHQAAQAAMSRPA